MKKLIKILQNMKETKAPGIDNTHGKYLKDGAEINGKTNSTTL